MTVRELIAELRGARQDMEVWLDIGENFSYLSVKGTDGVKFGDDRYFLIVAGDES